MHSFNPYHERLLLTDPNAVTSLPDLPKLPTLATVPLLHSESRLDKGIPRRKTAAVFALLKTHTLSFAPVVLRMPSNAVDALAHDGFWNTVLDRLFFSDREHINAK